MRLLLVHIVVSLCRGLLFAWGGFLACRALAAVLLVRCARSPPGLLEFLEP